MIEPSSDYFDLRPAVFTARTRCRDFLLNGSPGRVLACCR